MTFSGQTWTKRFEDMGDASEARFEEVAASLGRNPVRAGLNRPPFSVAQLPKKERYRPDYLDSKGFIECQGLGRDGTFKLKLEKYAALSAWHVEHEVSIFIWDSHKKRYAIIALDDLTKIVNEGNAALGYFPEPKAYLAIKVDQFPNWIKAAVQAS